MSLPLIPETGLSDAETIRRVVRTLNNLLKGNASALLIQDNVPAPTYAPGKVTLYVDAADGDLKAVFGDGVIKTIVTDT